MLCPLGGMESHLEEMLERERERDHYNKIVKKNKCLYITWETCKWGIEEKRTSLFVLRKKNRVKIYKMKL